jgi:hypothetical protein
VGQAQDNADRGNTDGSKESTFNSSQVMANENINDQQHGNDRCAVTHITNNYTTTCNIQSQYLSINE